MTGEEIALCPAQGGNARLICFVLVFAEGEEVHELKLSAHMVRQQGGIGAPQAEMFMPAHQLFKQRGLPAG